MTVRILRHLLSPLLLACACTSGTETGNPPVVDGLIAVNASSSAPDTIALRAPGQKAQVDEVWVNMGAISLRGGDDCEAFDAQIPALGIDDHGGSAPALLEPATETGAFCTLELSLPAQSTTLGPTQPDGLATSSVVIRGQAADGRPFDITPAAPLAVSLTSQVGPIETGLGAPRMLLLFDVAAWIGDTDLAQLEPSASSIVVTPGTHPDLAAQLGERIAQGIALYVDEDADGAADNPVPIAHSD